MVNQLGSGVGAVFIDDGERGGIGFLGVDAKYLAQSADEGGLSGAHLAVESENGVVAHQPGKFAGCLGKRFE